MGRKRNTTTSNFNRKGGEGGVARGGRHGDNKIQEIKRLQQETATANFSSSELSYKGSDKLVFITNGDNIKTIWKKILKKEAPLIPNDIKILIGSALVVTDKKSGHEVEELVTELGNPEKGLKKLREIINFPSMSCDAGLQENVLSFQHVILPLMGLLTRTAITECILEKYVHAIFSDSFLSNVINMLNELVQRDSLMDNSITLDKLLARERYTFIPSSLGIFFLVIVRLLTELLCRIKEATLNETMHKVSKALQESLVYYRQLLQQGFYSNTADPLIQNVETRKYFFQILDKEVKKINLILNNERITLSFQNSSKNSRDSELINSRYKELAKKADMNRSYDPPGELSKKGRRHDNDFKDISEMSIIPTEDEILCDRRPFLPSVLPDTLHFLPDGAERLLDTQFRLLREDMLNPIREGIKNFLYALSDNNTGVNRGNDDKSAKELMKIQKDGGKFKYENGDIQIYVRIQFVEIVCDRRNGLVCTLRFDPKYRKAKNEKERKEFWEKSKRLMNGSLVCLLLPKSNKGYSLYFGVVISRNDKSLAKNADYAEIGINFMDPSIYTVALAEISKSDKISLENRFMVESTGVYLESYYHFLKIIQTTNPFTFPFEKYFAPNLQDQKRKNMQGFVYYDDADKVDPPMYARAPGFRFDLSAICNNRNVRLNVADTGSYDNAARNINKYGKLDQTQAKALISALTREVALIEGPPGTGKTVVGIEIMKVLLAQQNSNTRLGPILTVCFTNHALDQFLEHLLDDNITTNLVRIGSRTKSEKIKHFNLEEVCKKRKGKGSYLIARLHESLAKIEKDIKEIQEKIFKKWLSWDDVYEYLMLEKQDIYDQFMSPYFPDWVLNVEGEPVFDQWVQGEDLRIISKSKERLLNPRKGGNKRKQEEQYDYETLEWIHSYNIPNGNRPLNVLLNTHSVWHMSKTERHTLHDHWKTKILDELTENLSTLRKAHDEKRKEMNEIYEEGRREVLLDCDVIGMTTNGAAKSGNLLRSIGPKIVICEEAGEVLEAHILSTLTSSTQHLILIGDHNQLRPHIATYTLSIDSSLGNNYQLDKSLFERLVLGDKAMKIEKSRLLTQRRMRGEISDLIRHTLYPDLIDGENTIRHPDVRGAQHNVYFIEHRNSEDSSGGEFAMQSHVNTYEIKMVVEMVKYFVSNGYTKPDDIAVLTPYLGQMIKIRDALKKSFAVIIDERDAQEIAEFEEQVDEAENETSVATKKSLNQQVNLRTVDNFQGEEAKIVIISLVRNVSTSGNNHGSIGFLKSSNRTNVLLSRAREGMYLIGNSELMASKSKDMWAPIIRILRSRNQVGFGMPIQCARHPHNKHIIVEPEQFKLVSTNGGCFEPCGVSLACGHACTYRCHADDPKHLNVTCQKPCSRLHPRCNHPCDKLCKEDCGKCNFLVGDITLPCGHVCPSANCQQNLNKSALRCVARVDKKYPHCDHTITMMCYESIKDLVCDNMYGDIMLRCGHVFPDGTCLQNQHKHLLQCKTRVDKRYPKCHHTINVMKLKCNNIYGDIILRCGHVWPNATCQQNQNQKNLQCMIRVDKQYRYCQHTVNVMCCETVDNLKCDNICGSALSCGHRCTDKCINCQQRAGSRLTNDNPHAKCNDLCNKILFCGHICKRGCHEGESCLPCKKECMISCEHKTCDKICLEPCVICAKPCAWECTHQGKCELSCGVPCYRLPCNKRCEKKLECGHLCPGVCGELCPPKIYCITCASEDIRSQQEPPPDFRKGMKFNDIYWDVERMIILSCGHFYTMECMDYYMEIGEYYNGSTKGGWTSIKTLSTTPVSERTCPACRIPIKNIKRYGRRIKKCTLDVQNRKFIQEYDRRLKNIANQIISYNKNAERINLKNQLRLVSSTDPRPKEEIFKEVNALDDVLPELTPYQYFNNVEKYHGFEPSNATVWIPHVNKLMNIYQDLSLIILAAKNPPHKKAFEASISSFDLTALLGFSVPKMEKRIYLDAFFEIINIQNILFHEILFIIEEVPRKSIFSYLFQRVVEVKYTWQKFAERLQRTIQSHLNTIIEAAEPLRYDRHLLLSRVEILESEIKTLIFQLKYPQDGVKDTDKLRIKQGFGGIQRSLLNIKTSDEYTHVVDKEFSSDLEKRLSYLLKNCYEASLETRLNHSILENLEFRRIKFDNSDNLYECANGHPYTIVTDVNKCPECNVKPIAE
ncbi:1267_t:CDS:10 [Funneliformis mosseae]|uniref:1267_t:CDS:1 n=1 Tax=Funneliformis mosseae TaxID=27381 RepID=A0A9N9BJZ3_FUNMO|nr:1267_t:CDS:10 [Funneliformis mosseae]